ncbi:MAG TPA: hypothetical protein VNB06_09540 [Thermoanaerobaculia bacterium]|nr:hypothetical protein [Thermoanaerobaculia bacterium]
MNPLFVAALETQRLCQEHGWPCCVIGGLAVQRWGEPRLTRDVDVSLLCGWGNEDTVVDALLQCFGARRGDARDFALRYRVVLLKAANGVPIDVALAAMPFEERAQERASGYAVGDGAVLRTCSAEDLVVFKVFAGRPHDWLDVEGIVTRQAGRLARKQILQELEPLLALKEDTDSMARLEKLLGA